MLISYKWLQSYFEEKLPPPEKLAERITFGFAEVESVEKKGDDTIMDVKVLPDRACYALSHKGVAYEVGAILGIKAKQKGSTSPSDGEVEPLRPFSVQVEAPELCLRYMARVVESVTAKELPWVKEHLEAIGQRSINPVVDGANIVMFDMGQPLHAFDADKVEGDIVVRRARKGEKITTLDNKEVNLDESVLIIADEKSPLAIAGIKGGKKAEVTSATRNLILESANFDASHIRKTSERLGIRTDASKRFENKLSPEMASVGMNDFSAYLFEMAKTQPDEVGFGVRPTEFATQIRFRDKQIKAGEIIDRYPEKQKERTIAVPEEYIAKKLGIKISSKQIEEILSRLLITVEKKENGLLLTPPVFRMDLNIPEDIAEEVGRIIGYYKIPAELPPKSKGVVTIPKSSYYEWKIREILVNAGFSEVMTSSFAEKGSVAILKPLAEDKKYAREDLRGGFAAALRMNFLNAPLLGSDEVRVFEIGKVFSANSESTALALGYAGPKKKGKTVLKETRELLEKILTVQIAGEEKEGIFECNLEEVFDKLPEPQKWDISISSAKPPKFHQFSQYPFIVRDVALFVSADTLPESVEKIIKKNAGKFVVRGPSLFDEFFKDGKKSLAFRLVFQSFGRTLTDEEINASMEKIYTALKVRNWQIR